MHLTVVKDHRGSTRNVAHLMVADATGLYGHLVAHGTRIVKGLRDADHGLRGFVFSDPDGNRIDVGQLLLPAVQRLLLYRSRTRRPVQERETQIIMQSPA